MNMTYTKFAFVFIVIATISVNESWIVNLGLVSAAFSVNSGEKVGRG